MHRCAALQSAVCSGTLLEAASACLGADVSTLVLDAAALLVAPRGFRYRQGFHRDAIATAVARLSPVHILTSMPAP